MRVSTLPTIAGEKVVIRLLDKKSLSWGLDELGFSRSNLELFRKMIHRSHGLILVTGPTGAGKTTTLYAALQELDTASQNIVTIEDPVEYRLEGIIGLCQGPAGHPPPGSQYYYGWRDQG